MCCNNVGRKEVAYTIVSWKVVSCQSKKSSLSLQKMLLLQKEGQRHRDKGSNLRRKNKLSETDAWITEITRIHTSSSIVKSSTTTNPCT